MANNQVHILVDKVYRANYAEEPQLEQKLFFNSSPNLYGRILSSAQEKVAVLIEHVIPTDHCSEMSLFAGRHLQNWLPSVKGHSNY